ncbi:hypothetical protein P9112_010152 [Eukaryota sp. TZLM1-RC]
MGRSYIGRLNVDTIGPLNTDNEDNKFLLVFVDSFRYTILAPLKELDALETADALIWNVCAISGIAMLIHSDNGPEFANETFRILCNGLAIEISNSIPHYSENNGLVNIETFYNAGGNYQDFNDYDNWSTYVPLFQQLINSTKSRRTCFTLSDFMFGSSISPRADPANILGNLSKFDSNIPLLDDIKLKRFVYEKKGKKQSVIMQ